MKKIILSVKNNFIVLISGIILGFFALLLVHFLPTEPMKENVRWSMEMIEKEFTDEELIAGYKTTLTGNFTDCLMMEHAVYSNGERGELEQALQMYRSETYNNEEDPEGWWPGQSLKDYVEGVPQPREVSYSRYWHGYLVLLKPLLFLTTFNNIRLINAIVQFMVTGVIIILLGKKREYLLSGAFMLSIPFLYFVSTYASLSLSVCFYIMNIAVLVQCIWDDEIYKREWYGIFFLVLGMLTSYFDLLTYPLVTLGYPLCIYFCFHSHNMKKSVVKFVGYCAEWFVGYGGMWISKWILTDILTDSSTIKDALNTIQYRTQSAEGGNRITGFFSVLAKNMAAYANWSFMLLCGVIMIVFILGFWKQRGKIVTKKISAAFPLFMVALLPFAWYFVTQNHSEQHWQFTCRILAITVFAGVAGIIKLCDSKGDVV